MKKEWGNAPALALLVLAVFSLSTSVIFIRLSELPPMQLSAFRLLGAAAVLSPVFWRDWRRQGSAVSPRMLGMAVIIPGLVFGIHLVLWVVGARLTLAANATLAVNMVPAVLPLFLWLIVGERVTGRELAGTALGLAGLGLLAGGDLRLGGELWKGDLICIVAMLFLALYLALGRRNGPRFPTNWLYMVPVYTVAGSACLAASALTGEPLGAPSWRECALVGALLFFPTILGHRLVNLVLRSVRGQVVGIFHQGQFISAGTLAFFVFGELPRPSFAMACALVVGGALIVSWTRLGGRAVGQQPDRP
ncbi:DMT family transporter [soil metagenome]